MVLLLAALLAAAGQLPTTHAATLSAQDATLAAYPNQAATQYMGLVGSGNDTAGGNGCPAGTHHPALRTYILTIPCFTLVPASSPPGSVGGLHELRVQLADAPPVMPIIINGGPGRGLQQGLLDTLRFLADWAELAAEAPHGITMPGEECPVVQD